jgi:hypothetical protein
LNHTPQPFTNFVVKETTHDWVHVAIDRFSRQIIDGQVEVVTE